MSDENKLTPVERGALGGDARAAKLPSEQRTEIARKAAKTRWNSQKVATDMSNDNSMLPVKMPTKLADPRQGVLDLGIGKQIEIDGIGMGVLSDGTPFLTERGLARLCGVNHFVIQGIASEWSDTPAKARITNIKDLLGQRGLVVPNHPYIAITQRSGTFFAYSDVICLAVLEYYAFDAGVNVKEQAKKNFRLLAGTALRNFIYTQVGYDPNYAVPEAWRQFHDRVALTYNSVPHGYFGIFKEMADMIVTLGQAGMQIDSKFVPDISVGRCWAEHWTMNEFEKTYGSRVHFPHHYPDYFPQAKSNPQDCWCYPDQALGEFRRWLRDDYIGGGKFKKYLTEKVKRHELPVSFAQLAIAAYGGSKEIEGEEA